MCSCYKSRIQHDSINWLSVNIHVRKASYNESIHVYLNV